MSQDPLLVPKTGLLSGCRFRDVFFTLPQPSVRWSIAGCNRHDVQICCLFEPHASRWAPILLPFLSRLDLGA
jgi:hypothetical protein